MNRVILFLSVLCAAVILSACVSSKDAGNDTDRSQPLFYDEEACVSYGYRVDGRYLSVYDGQVFVPTYLNGVNMGSGCPGYFPGELAISKESYKRWFEQIAAMNCNCVRTYTTMMPCFYEALYEYNSNSEHKLYLLMGTWYDENILLDTYDAYELLDEAVDEAKRMVDIIHGNFAIEQRTGEAYGTYITDVSDYVMGWILGIESEAEFIGGTNEKHPEITAYDGYYFEVANSDAFHAFLCELADCTVAYETEKYGIQRPVSWTNWPPADALSHAEGPSPGDDAVSINVEIIKAKDTFIPGTFASYHIYPYYPDFMMLDEAYITHTDGLGKINTYEAYLQDLMSIHSIPVLVAEFGVPTSRGCTHVNKYTHYNQGHIEETEQGEYLADMAQNIYDCGYAGGLVFTWQDEWFKPTWNTRDYSDSDRRVYWSDTETSETSYGLLSFDPGEERMKVLIDGNFEDWENESPLVREEGNGALSVYAQHDERFLYLCVRGTGFDPSNERVVIPIDVTPLSGSYEYDGRTFQRKSDFVVELNGREDTAVLVHRYYDRYAFLFGPYDDEMDLTGYDDRETDAFVPVYLSLNRARIRPDTGTKFPSDRMDTGHLNYGNASPESDDFNSLADFIYGDDFVELRIPWGVLGFRDPSTREVEGDFWAAGQNYGLYVDCIYIGLSHDERTNSMTSYTWDIWDIPVYHERLKKSYDIIGNKFAELAAKWRAERQQD